LSKNKVRSKVQGLGFKVKKDKIPIFTLDLIPFTLHLQAFGLLGGGERIRTDDPPAC